MFDYTPLTQEQKDRLEEIKRRKSLERDNILKIVDGIEKDQVIEIDLDTVGEHFRVMGETKCVATQNAKRLAVILSRDSGIDVTFVQRTGSVAKYVTEWSGREVKVTFSKREE